MKILIVEDEHHLAEGLRFNLEAENFAVELASDGGEALRFLVEENKQFDVIVLDVMLPEVDGFTVAQTLRKKENFTPILMLTARNRPEDVLRGFEAGADDYLPKPFELKIFLARLNGLLRRREWFRREEKSAAATAVAAAAEAGAANGSFVINGKTIDFESLELQSGAETIHLTLMEVRLLRYLIENAGKPVSRKTILEEVWDLHEDTDTRAIDNFIVRLRRYLEDEPEKPKILQTVRGVGYKFVKES
ncbi:MAG: response regulator transcription factor [Acidobacteriota bacterium]|nr:response regulator transcription factor [Acidobacteriota bacterium]